MTLIVGRIVNNGIRFISDSKITDENAVRNNVLSGNLKSFIVHHSTCVCFAGNTYFAEKFLTEFYSKKISNLKELLLCCLNLNIESNDETVFCIGNLNNNKSQLFKISERKIENNLKSVWIGDKIAFNKYQELYHSSTKENEFQRMEESFDRIVKDEKIETVSDFQISTETVFHSESKSHIFIYGFKTSISFAPQTFKSKSRTTTITIPHGGPEIGGFGACYLRSININEPGIAIHFPQGKFGVLFCPKLSRNNAIIIKEPDGECFAYEIKKKYGIVLEGLVTKNGNAIKYIITE